AYVRDSTDDTTQVISRRQQRILPGHLAIIRVDMIGVRTRQHRRHDAGYQQTAAAYTARSSRNHQG
ncbi:hypothetical protein CJ430_31990, partial [Klebsiella pneumoniae]